jgi:TRAP-type C4-dicarboxylate transport system permease small subunit
MAHDRSPRNLPERIARAGEHVAVAMLLVMTVLVVLQVVARDVFQVGLAWADELARYAGLSLVYLTVPLLLLQNRHVAVDLVIARLGGRLRQAADLVIELLILAFCLLFLWGGWAFMQRAGRFSTAALGMPNLLFYLPVMIGVGLLLMASVVRLTRQVAALRSGLGSSAVAERPPA